MSEGWLISETAILRSGLPFSMLSQPYIANGNGVFKANGASSVHFNAAAYANRISGVSIPARFGTLESTISPPAGLLGVGFGGNSSPRMIAFKVESSSDGLLGPSNTNAARI